MVDNHIPPKNLFIGSRHKADLCFTAKLNDTLYFLDIVLDWYHFLGEVIGMILLFLGYIHSAVWRNQTCEIMGLKRAAIPSHLRPLLRQSA